MFWDVGVIVVIFECLQFKLSTCFFETFHAIVLFTYVRQGDSVAAMDAYPISNRVGKAEVSTRLLKHPIGVKDSGEREQVRFAAII